MKEGGEIKTPKELIDLQLKSTIAQIRKYGDIEKFDYELIDINGQKKLAVKNEKGIIMSFWDLDGDSFIYRGADIGEYSLILKYLNISENLLDSTSKTSPKELYNLYSRMNQIYQRLSLGGIVEQRQKLDANNAIAKINVLSFLNNSAITLLDISKLIELSLFDKTVFSDNSYNKFLNKKKEEFKEWIEKGYDDIGVIIRPLSKLKEYALAKGDWQKQQDITTQYGKLDIHHKTVIIKDIDFIQQQGLISEEEALEYKELIEIRDKKRSTKKDLSSLKGDVGNLA